MKTMEEQIKQFCLKFCPKFRVNSEQENRIWLLLQIWVLLLLISLLTPRTIFNIAPATGGDTASHFYPLYTLVKQGLPNFSLRVWNPGNLMGEPHFLHYFPGPYLIMAFLSLFMPLGLAFNLGTILPLFAFPVCVLLGFRGMGYKLHTGFLAALASFLYVFNESHSMWGGNAQSLLAGQFAHMYALDFLFLFLGAVGWELRSGKKNFLSAFLLMLIAITHTYIFLLTPFFFLSLIFAFDYSHWKERLKYLFWIGLIGFLLAFWFILPQLMNAPWTLAVPVKWTFTNFWKEVIPPGFRPFLSIYGFLLVAVVLLVSKNLLSYKLIFRETLFWLIPVLASIAMFLYFPRLGLADIRSIPQIQHIAIMFAFILLGHILDQYSPQTILISILFMIPLTFWWTHENISNYPHWIRWNYSSWKTKQKFSEVQGIADQVKGSFSDPRMANEHHASLNDTGTPRVWELLPYFAKRSTMESLFVEATFTAPLTQWLQGRISLNPSCPARGNWNCPSLNFKNIEPNLKLLGVRDLILTTPEAIKKIETNPSFHLTAKTASFKVYSLKEPVSLVETIEMEPTQIQNKTFKKDFMTWFYEWNGTQPHLIYSNNFDLVFKNKIYKDPKIKCTPSVEVKYDSITLNTPCPHFLHLLKFTYHPSWKASTNDEIVPISPGFMALVPSEKKVTLRFGPSFDWSLSGLISLLTALFITLKVLNNRFRFF